MQLSSQLMANRKPISVCFVMFPLQTEAVNPSGLAIYSLNASLSLKIALSVFPLSFIDLNLRRSREKGSLFRSRA